MGKAPECDPAADVADHLFQSGDRDHWIISGLCQRLFDHTGGAEKLDAVSCAVHLPHGVSEPEDGLCLGVVMVVVFHPDGILVHRFQVFGIACLLRNSG
jgi:hypothetical protein